MCVCYLQITTAVSSWLLFYLGPAKGSPALPDDPVLFMLEFSAWAPPQHHVTGLIHMHEGAVF